MLEIEAKVRVDDHEPVRARLKALGARFIGRYVETNYILDLPDGSLRDRGCGLRVREMCVEQGEPAAATMTYKGPRRESTMKVREEIEVEVSDGGTALAIVQAIGFETVVSYRKRRERWELDGCLFELDEVPMLGWFVEIEGADEATIQRTMNKVGLGSAVHVSKSYVGLLAEACRAAGRSTIGIGFE